MNLDAGFQMFLTVHSVSNTVVYVSISASCVIFGSDLPGVGQLKFKYRSMSWGLFGEKGGYLYESDLRCNGDECRASGVCTVQSRPVGPNHGTMLSVVAGLTVCQRIPLNMMISIKHKTSIYKAGHV